jgi:very-long-chain enoyl-CoA reductase
MLRAPVANDALPKKPFGALPARAHNTLSYGVAALVLPLCLQWSQPETFWIAGAWIFHFARRTAEALFVHRYSGRPVPPGDYLVEYLYYWGFAYWIARGLNATAGEESTFLLASGLLLFVLGEAGNAWAHQKLRALRTSFGSSEKKVPRGGAFELVACPHYLFEIMSWSGFAVMTRVTGAFVFLGAGAAILATYARTRHLAYQKEFDGRDGRPLYPATRRALVPLVF